MNWDAIGAVGEIAGAIAVVASLVYLATQLRQNSKMLRLASGKHVIEFTTRVGEIALQDESLVALMLKPKDELNEIEQARLTILGGRMITGVQSGFDNSYEPSDLDGFAAVMHGLYHREGINYAMPDVWPAYREMLKEESPEFVAWFDHKVVRTKL